MMSHKWFHVGREILSGPKHTFGSVLSAYKCGHAKAWQPPVTHELAPGILSGLLLLHVREPGAISP
jgi:hypothetical protein